MAHQDYFAGRVLTDMQDGVMVIDRTGRLVTFNDAAQRILGLSRADLAEATFAEVFLVLEQNDEFNQAVLDAIYNQSVAQHREVPFTHLDSTVMLSLTTSFLYDESTGERQNAGVIVVFSDITKVRQLQETEARSAAALKAKHRELQEAFRSIEDSNTKLADALKKVNAVRQIAGGFAVLLVLGLAIAYWTMGRLGKSPAQEIVAVSNMQEGTVLHTVTPRPLTMNLSLTGRLAPLQTVNVSSPLSGRLTQVNVRYGDTVRAGDVLAVLDTGELQMKLREARSAVIRADENLRQLIRWDHSPDVTRARRSVIKAKLALDAQKKALDEAERLYSKGIIPANELESVKQQFTSQQLDYQSAEDEIASVVARGSGDQQQIARMELENQRARLMQYEAEMTQAVVRAPVSGIVMKPVAPGADKNTRQMVVGEAFTQGEILLALGDLSGMLVTSKVDEVEVTKLKTGQTVVVTGDAFPGIQLAGQLRGVSAQPAESETRALPTFLVQVTVNSLSESERQRVWVGMSAQLDVQTYHQPQALIVPSGAVVTGNGQSWVWKQNTANVSTTPVPVVTGHTLIDGVEILQGLQAGDVVVLGKSAADLSSPPVAPTRP